MQKLQGKVAVITGGNSGIGFAIAQRFVSEGAYVFIMGRRQAQLDEALSVLGENAEAVQGDVTKPDDLARLFETVKTRKGRLDILVPNSGISEYAPLEAISAEHFDHIFGINVRATLFTVQAESELVV